MDLPDRMKAYELPWDTVLPIRVPVVLRLDGRGFHSLTRKMEMEKPFDDSLARAIEKACYVLMKEAQNSRFGYLQSDEMSILLIDYNKFGSQQWLGGRVQKMVSIAAAIASVGFTLSGLGMAGHFDCRVFMVPKEDLINYFIWRQRDAERNSILGVAQKYYSHKELHKKNCDEMQEMIFQAGDNWSGWPVKFKRGYIIPADSGIVEDPPIFSQDRKYLERFMSIEEE